MSNKYIESVTARLVSPIFLVAYLQMIFKKRSEKWQSINK